MKFQKQNIWPIFLITFSLFLNSCSTNHERERREIQNPEKTQDLIETFDIAKEQAEEFKEEPIQKEDLKKVNKLPEPSPQPVKATSKKEKTKEVLKGKPAKAVPPVPTPTPVPPAVPVELVYPAGYPEEYKAYDLKSKSVWEKFNPVFYAGEQSVMAISYLGVTAGYITIISKGLATVKDKPTYHYYARFKSSDAYRYFYWLDDYIESYVEKDTFLPLKYQLIQREKKQNVDDLQLFDFDKMMTYHWFKKVKDGQTKKEKIEKPLPRYAQDSFSALQFVRGLPLNKGDVYEIPVVTRGKIWQLKVEVLGLDTTSVNGKDMRAIKIKAETSFPGVLKKSGDILFWYGADTDRRLLKFQAKIKIGSIFGEIVEYKPGTLIK